MDSPRTILRTLRTAKKILIPLHLRPDGDAVGSALACHYLLKSFGKRATLISADPIPENYLFLPGAKRIKIIDPARLDLSNFDLILLVDNGDPSRFSRTGKVDLPPHLLLINIDHHSNNRGFGNLNYVVPHATSTAEILYDLFKFWKVKVTPEIADCLLTGIYTDTSGFLHPTTTAGSLAKAADLIRKGANHVEIIENSFRSWPPKTLKLWRAVLDNVKRRKDVIYSQLSYPEVHLVGSSRAELASVKSFALDNLLITIRGANVAVMFTEEKPKQIRVSLRSKGRFDVAKIAEKMGGGGHIHAAAFDFKGPLKEAVAKTLRLVVRR